MRQRPATDAGGVLTCRGRRRWSPTLVVVLVAALAGCSSGGSDGDPVAAGDETGATAEVGEAGDAGESDDAGEDGDAGEDADAGEDGDAGANAETGEGTGWPPLPEGPEIPRVDEIDIYAVLATADRDRCAALFGEGVEVTFPSRGTVVARFTSPPGNFSTGLRTYHLYVAAAHLCTGDRDAAWTAYSSALEEAPWEPLEPADRDLQTVVCVIWKAVTELLDPGQGICPLEVADDGAQGTGEETDGTGEAGDTDSDDTGGDDGAGETGEGDGAEADGPDAGTDAGTGGEQVEPDTGEDTAS